MIDLEILPMVEMTPGQKKALQIRTESSCIEAGRNAFLVGMKKADCPRFRDPNMATYWKFGWKWEREDRNAKIPRSQRIFHPEVMEKNAMKALCE